MELDTQAKDPKEERKRRQQTAEAAMLHDNTISPRDERKARGKALRASYPVEDHAGFKVAPNRPDPVDVLEKSNQGRLPELIPLRYGRMMQSPFTFYRGAAALMAVDLANTPTMKVRVQVCGDCHLLNFGAFRTPERNIVFDINDFDETLPAPWEWDLKRLTVSFVLTARDNGLKPRYATEAVEAVVRSYRDKMGEYSKMSILDIWYDRVDFDRVIEGTTDAELQKRSKDQLKKEKKRTIQDYYFPKLTEQKDGSYLIKDSPPVMYHVPSEDRKAYNESVHNALTLYAESLQEDRRRLFNRYKLADFAIKVVGIGSVGTMCAVALMLAPDDEPLFLQFKEARESVLEPFAGKSIFENHGQRVVEGQRIVQSASDIFLGWTKFHDGKHFYLRQLRDTKVKPEPQLWEGPQLVEIAEVMGAVLARAHARSGDSAVIKGYLGSDDGLDKAIADYSLAYANQVEKDHAALQAAVRSGRIKAISDQE
jgi:uncharacterized protein (DUF2252 family)